MSQVGNWITQSSSTFGQGDLLLTSTAPGFSSFTGNVSAGEVWYSILDGANREAGVGNYDGASTITRTTVNATLIDGVYSESGTPLNLSGASVVSCTFNKAAYDEIVAKIASLEFAVTPAEIKTAYESNADTNAFTDGQEAKLENLPNPGPVELVPAAPITWDVDLPLRERLVRKLHGALNFTRASTADYVNKSGITETAEIDEPAITAEGMSIYEDEFIAGRAADIASIQMSGNMPPPGEPFAIVIDVAIPDSSSTVNYLYETAGFYRIGLYFQNGNLRFRYRNGSDINESFSFVTSVKTIDEPVRYILRFDGSNLEIAENGGMLSESALIPDMNYDLDAQLNIGTNEQSVNPINSEERNFFIVHRALLDSEIYALGRADGLIPYLPFKPADLGTPDIIVQTDSPTEISIDFDVVDGATDYVIRVTPI